MPPATWVPTRTRSDRRPVLNGSARAVDRHVDGTDRAVTGPDRVEHTHRVSMRRRDVGAQGSAASCGDGLARGHDVGRPLDPGRQPRLVGIERGRARLDQRDAGSLWIGWLRPQRAPAVLTAGRAIWPAPTGPSALIPRVRHGTSAPVPVDGPVVRCAHEATTYRRTPHSSATGFPVASGAGRHGRPDSRGPVPAVGPALDPLRSRPIETAPRRVDPRAAVAA